MRVNFRLCQTEWWFKLPEWAPHEEIGIGANMLQDAGHNTTGTGLKHTLAQYNTPLNSQVEHF